VVRSLSGRKRRWVLFAVVALVLVAAALGVRQLVVGRQAMSEADYATAAVRRGDLVVTVSGTGPVAAKDRRAILPGVAGEAVAVAVEPGQKVKAGDVLVTLDNDALVAGLEQARANLKEAEALLAATVGTTAAGTASTGSGGGATSALTVVAPADGILTSFTVNPGSRITQGLTVGIVVGASEVAFVADVTRTELDLVQPGQEVAVEFDQFAGQILGRVASVGQERQGETVVWYQLKVLLPNTGLLKAGMAGAVLIPYGNDQIRRRGTTEWVERNLVQSQVAGTVEEVVARNGGFVKRGQVLLRVHSDTLPAEAEGQRARVRQAEADAAQREEDVASLVVRAPIDGTVLAVAVDPGDQVTATTQLAAVGDLDHLVVTVAVDELDVAKVQAGQPAAVTFEALPGRSFQGAVTAIALEGTAQSGVTTYDVEVEIPGDAAIRPGMTAAVAIEVGRRANVLLVPVETVSARGEVTVLVNGKLEARRVKVGLQNDVDAEVLSGLQEGDMVLLATPDTALPGMFFRNMNMEGHPGREGSRAQPGPGAAEPGAAPTPAPGQ